MLKLKDIQTPANSCDITEAWVNFILNEYENSKNPGSIVEVLSFTFGGATKPGESFNAELVRLDVTTLLCLAGRPPDEKEEKDYNLIVKFISRDPFSSGMIRKFEYHLKEFLMYSEVIPEFNKFQATKTDNLYPIHVPEYIYGKCTDKDYVLVIQNMKYEGFSTNPKELGLNLEQTKMALEHIARLHGISYAYDKAFNFLEKYPAFHFSSAISALFKPVVYVSVDNTIKFLRTREDCKDVVAKLESGRRKIPEKFEALWDDLSRHKLVTLSHGDFWNSNLLYSKSRNGELKDVCVIDWQITQWNSPLMDLHYLINTSTTGSLRSDHMDELLLHYYSALTSITVALGSPIANWTFDQFKVEFERLALVGLLMGICLIQGTLSKAGEKINPNQEDDTCCCACVPRAAKLAAAKIIVPLAFHPSCSCILNFSIKKLLKPIGRELISGQNTIMNDRLVDLIQEAEKKGLLDILNL